MTTVNRKAVNQMIVSTMLTALDGSGIKLYGPHEAPPDHDADKAGDTPVTRWCKVHRVAMNPASKPDGADERAISFTITVGVSGTLAASSPHRMDEDLQTVHEAAENAYAAHGDAKHTMQLFDAQSDILTTGDHERDAIGVVSVIGSARRKV